MKNPVRTLICLFIILCSELPILFSQDCNAILHHGLKNIAISKSEGAKIATNYFNNCGSIYSSLSDSQLATVEVSVFGYGSGNVGYSRAQREEKLNQWCETNKTYAESHRSDYQEAQVIYAPAVAAWDSCNRLASNSVQIVPLISPDDRTVDIKIKYSGPGHDVKLQKILTEAFVCTISGSAKDNVALPIVLTNDLVNVNCRRNAAVAVNRAGTNYAKVERGTISVPTGGETIQLFFPERWDPELPDIEARKLRADVEKLKQAVPPGTIIAYAGENLPPGWLWCNGKSYPNRGEYDRLFQAVGYAHGREASGNFMVPDLRGKFVRGMDRDGSAIDSDRINEHKGIGSSQEDQIKTHSHALNKATFVGSPYPIVVNKGGLELTANPDYPPGALIGEGLGNETRPKNVALNWIIKY